MRRMVWLNDGKTEPRTGPFANVLFDSTSSAIFAVVLEKKRYSTRRNNVGGERGTTRLLVYTRTYNSACLDRPRREADGLESTHLFISGRLQRAYSGRCSEALSIAGRRLHCNRF